MSESILILGASGSGKSSACANLDPERTLLISVDGKRPPFSLRGWGTMTQDTPQGAFYVPKRENLYGSTKGAIKAAVDAGKKIIVVDDSQFLLANDFFGSALEKGFDKFNRLGHSFWTFIDFLRDLPDDVTTYMLHHTDNTTEGQVKPKTIGKMLDDKGSIEGRFTVCLLATKKEGQHIITADLPNDSVIKAPPGMFPIDPMENDLATIDASVREYWGM